MEWPTVELGSAAEIRGGATPRRANPTYWNGDIPWVTPTDLPALGEGIVDVENTADAITEEGLASCSASLLPPGTVLFSSRASIGKIGIASVSLTTNQGFANLIPRLGLESRYLAWCLHFHSDRIAGLAGSTTFKEVAKSALKRFRIPLPPLSEQRRIVEILDQVDHLRRRRADADAKTERILPALFIKMFGDPATNPMGWPVRPLRSFLNSVERRDPAKCQDEQFVYVDIASIDGATGRIVSTKKMFGHEAPGRARQVIRASDVLVSTVRPYLRATAMVPEKLDGQIGSTGFCVLRSATGAGHGYLYALSRMSWFTEQLNSRARGASYPAVTDRDIWDLPVPLPDDCALLSHADAVVKKAMEIQEAQRRNSEHLQAVFKGLLHRAFTGDLTASWREAYRKELLQEMEHQATTPIEK